MRSEHPCGKVRCLLMQENGTGTPETVLLKEGKHFPGRKVGLSLRGQTCLDWPDFTLR
jgi:hypothetical protein